MIGDFHVELNGVKYRLAEDAEGHHYRKVRSPLRAQTAGIVQGESGKFQLRPDLLAWTISDWSGGEGNKVYSDEFASQYYYGYNINPFKEAGSLQLGPKLSVAKDSGGTNPFTVPGFVVPASEDVFWVDGSDSTFGIYLWDGVNEKFGTLIANATQDDLADLTHGFGDDGWVYYVENNFPTTNHIVWRMNAAGTKEQLSLARSPHAPPSIGGVIRKFFYVIEQETGTNSINVFEYDLTDTQPITPTEVYAVEFGMEVGIGRVPRVVTGANAIWFYSNQGNLGTLHRVTPTTSASAGFGEETLRLPGVQFEGIWYQLGFVYLLARQDGRTVIYYYDTINENFGVTYRAPAQRDMIAEVDNPWAYTLHGVSGFLSFFVHNTGPNGSKRDRSLMAFNQLTGGVAALGLFDVGTIEVPDDWATNSLQWFSTAVHANGDIFFSVSWNKTSTDKYRCIHADVTKFTTDTGVMESAVNDFGVVDEKVLTTITLITEPLPANTSVTVKYQLDQSGTWLTAGTSSTTNSTEKVFVVSTDATTRTFRNLQIRLELDTTDDTVTPVVRGVRSYATVLKALQTWDLLLKVDDELGRIQNRSWSGAKLISNVETAGDGETVVAFKDGYQAREANQEDEYDVVVDDYQVILSRPGEGIIQVRLREVI